MVTSSEDGFGAVEATPGTTPEATLQANTEATEDHVLGLLPDAGDLPDGYDLKEERVQCPDEVATLAS